MLVRDKINEIAYKLYERMSYVAPLNFDLACIALSEITGDSPDLDADLEE